MESQTPNFDEEINRTGSGSVKWDSMQAIYGVAPDDGLAMWVADMDFRAPPVVQDALQNLLNHGVYGYWGSEESCHDAIRWWMERRHGWSVPQSAIFTTHGLVNGVAICIDAYTNPGDKVVLMTPVYHAFARVIRAAEREVVECELAHVEGRYELDIAAWDAQMTGDEKMLILCSPHNPGGRVWSKDELRTVADFAIRHDLVLISDEIHHDLVFPHARTPHTPMALIDGIESRLIMLTAPSKTFNLAGAHSGNVIIPDRTLRKRFAQKMTAHGMSSNSFGIVMTEAAYSPEGEAWLEELLAYLNENRRIFDEGVNQIAGLTSMQLESTYLAWVDFSGTGMKPEEFIARVQNDAKIAANYGVSFGKGGEHFLRFNLATNRARVEDAVKRLQDAFADLQ